MDGLEGYEQSPSKLVIAVTVDVWWWSWCSIS